MPNLKRKRSDSSDEIVFQGHAVAAPKNKRQMISDFFLQKMEHIQGLETIFLDEANMSMNLAPIQLRSTKKGYYLPLYYSQIINRGAEALNFKRYRTVILVPKKIIPKDQDVEYFDAVVLFRHRTAYIVAILPWTKGEDPIESIFPPYLLNTLFKEDTWSLYDSNGLLIEKREDLSKTKKIKITEEGVKIYKIGSRIKLVKNEIFINAVLLKNEYTMEEVLQQPYITLLDPARIRKYFETAMKENDYCNNHFYTPKYSNFKLNKNDKIVNIQKIKYL